MVWDNAPCLKRFFSILGTSFCGKILIWNYFHWISNHSENTIGMVEAFLFSPANSCPCNQVTSCHVILYHIMSYYVMYQTCIQIVSSVKHLLISLFVEWHGTYVLGQICIEFIPVGVAKKVWTALGGQHFFNHSGGGKIFPASHWVTCQSPHI